MPARQLANGDDPGPRPSASITGGMGDTRTVIYARVSAYDEHANLDRWVNRVMGWASGQRLAVDQVVTEVGWAVGGGWLANPAQLLADPQATMIVGRASRSAGPIWSTSPTLRSPCRDAVSRWSRWLTTPRPATTWPST